MREADEGGQCKMRARGKGGQRCGDREETYRKDIPKLYFIFLMCDL